MFAPLKNALRRIITSRVVTRLIWPVVVTLPPLVFATSRIQGFASLRPPLESLRSWLDAHPAVSWICVSWTVILLIANYYLGPVVERIRETPDRLNARDMGILNRCFSETVGAKLELAGSCLKELCQNSNSTTRTTSEWFSSFLDPHDQIRLLIDKIFHPFFEESEEEEVEFKIVLAEMRGTEIKQFLFSSPRDHLPLATVEQINGVQNGFRAAAMAGKMLIIPDIAKEARKKGHRVYTALGEDPTPVGSIICYPIRHPHLNRIPFVLSIKCKKKNHFTEEGRKRYDVLIRHFASRILLEYTLSQIKERIV